MEPRRRLTDPDALKALAHPTRMALLGALVTEGPLTASQAAELVGESPSNCSWHLRRLAEHGFVREAEGGTGRNRPWEAAQQGLEWDEGEVADPAARVAADTLTDALLDREVQRLRAARANPDESPEWLAATGITQSQLWLTVEEAAEVSRRMQELMFEHGERHGDPSKRPEGARLVSLVGWVVPSGSHRVPRGGSGTDTAQDGEAS
jgi:DNA-binding transcriptional ArsR family regulator